MDLQTIVFYRMVTSTTPVLCDYLAIAAVIEFIYS